MTNEILDWPCSLCGVLNRYHEVFVIKNDDGSKYYQAQYRLEGAPELVPQFEHYAEPPFNNLEYLEYLYEQKSK